MHRLISKVKPDIIFLQETLVVEDKARQFMLKFVPSWYLCAVSLVGNSGGLLVTWDPNKFVMDPTLCGGGILLTGITLENHRVVNLLNVYGPCSERLLFWDRLVEKGLLAAKNLILAGDLNFTTGVDEVWGSTAQLDKHANYFKDMIKDQLLVDLVPDVLVPTWRNGRAGGAGITKRLDRFLVAEILLIDEGRYRSWVELPFISDHAPMIAQFDLSQVQWPIRLS
jgi:endonuclease/exonuclease/phosphatase family metal-dependent hydrolase